MGPIRNRLIVFFSAIAIILVVLEISLRVVGLIYADLSESDAVITDEQGDTILCIGDSVTFGIGAPKASSYPAQLQRLLDASHPDKKYKVINRGWPAQNTAQILNRFESWLQTFQPDVVTILIGAQNMANFYGYQEYLKETGGRKRGLLLRLHDFLDHVRVYKFARLLLRGNETITSSSNGESQPPEKRTGAQGKSITQSTAQKELVEDPSQLFRFPENGTVMHQGEESEGKPAGSTKNNNTITHECMAGFVYKSQAEYDKALQALLPVMDKPGIDSDCFYAVGGIYLEQQQYEEAIKWFKKGIQQAPDDYRLYEGIGQIYREQDKLDEALTWYKKGFEKARYDSLYERCYLEIALIFLANRNYNEAIDFFKKETRREPLLDDNLHKLAGDYLSMFKNRRTFPAIYAWIEADIEKFLKLCARYNAQPVLQSYPVEPMVNFIYKKIARRHGVIFVDHEATFEKYVNGRVLSKEYFAPDGHPNAKGYGLMANNLWMIFEKGSR